MWVMAKLATNAFGYKYVLFAIVGGAAAAALGATALWAAGRQTRRYAAAALLAWLPIAIMLRYRSLETFGPTNQMLKFAESTAETLGVDVVFDNNFDYLQFHYYGRAAARPRMFHFMDGEAQLKFNEDDTMVHAFTGLGQFTDIQVVDRRAFLRTHPRFAVISSVRFRDGWILPATLEDPGATVTLVREEKPLTAYLVTYSPAR
jgi:hypothetical protein